MAKSEKKSAAAKAATSSPTAPQASHQAAPNLADFVGRLPEQATIEDIRGALTLASNRCKRLQGSQERNQLDHMSSLLLRLEDRIAEAREGMVQTARALDSLTQGLPSMFDLCKADEHACYGIFLPMAERLKELAEGIDQRKPAATATGA